MDVLIKNGIVVTPDNHISAEIAIKDGKIQDIARPGTYQQAARVIDARGCYVVPGAIDTHTHIEEGYKDIKPKETWTQATRNAAIGGVTSVLNFIVQAEGKSMAASISDEIERINTLTCLDYGIHPIFNKYRDIDDVVAELPVLKEMGIPSVKAFTVYSEEEGYANDYAIYRVMRKLKELHGILGVHAENKSLTEHFLKEYVKAGKLDARYYAESKPSIIEAEAVRRVCMMAEETGCSTYIVHMSTKEAVDIVEEYRSKGLPIYGETCSQYMNFNDQIYLEPNGYREFISPPLRKPADQERLWQGVADGAISVFGSDHCPYGKDAKDEMYRRCGFEEVAYGGVGLLENAAVLFAEGVVKGRISPERYVELTSTNPAKMFGLYPKKGALAPGSDADIVIFDPEKEVVLGTELYDNVDWTAYEGKKIVGFPVMTMQRGNVLVQDGNFYGKAGDGRFLFGKLDEQTLTSIR